MNNIIDIHTAKKSISNKLTDDEQEILIYTQYSVKMALIETFEVDTNILRTLGEHGKTLAVEIEHAIRSLHGSKQLVDSLIRDGLEVTQ